MGRPLARAHSGLDVLGLPSRRHALRLEIPVTTTLPQTEAQFQSAVIELARMTGWLVAHFRPARTEEGWRTPVAADGKGFPDLVLVRERTLFRELKAERGRIRPEQQNWLDRLTAAGADAAVWRPSDWTTIATTLQDPTTTREG